MENITSFVFFLIGLVFLLKFLKIVWFYLYEIKKWGKVEGEIISSNIVYYVSKSDTDGWKLEVKYSYKIDNEIYFNDQYSKNNQLLMITESSAKNISKSYFVGQNVIVFYNKNKPKESVINSSFDSSNFLLIIMSFIAFYISKNV